jgi:hypothetical protein
VLCRVENKEKNDPQSLPSVGKTDGIAGSLLHEGKKVDDGPPVFGKSVLLVMKMLAVVPVPGTTNDIARHVFLVLDQKETKSQRE